MHDTYFTVLAFIEIVSCQLIRLRVRFSVRKSLDDITRKTNMIDRGVDDPLLFSCIWIKKENGIRYIRKYCTQGEYPISCEINFGNMVLFDFFLIWRLQEQYTLKTKEKMEAWGSLLQLLWKLSEFWGKNLTLGTRITIGMVVIDMLNSCTLIYEFYMKMELTEV